MVSEGSSRIGSTMLDGCQICGRLDELVVLIFGWKKRRIEEESKKAFGWM